jgi:hypothetical protein
MKFLGQLACLLLVVLCFAPNVAQATDYPPDLVCYIKDDKIGSVTGVPYADMCATNEYTQVCTSHALTHLASVGGVTVCTTNATIIAPGLLDAWYPEQTYYSGYAWYTGCTVPNTFPYTGLAAVPPNSCIGTTTTPQDDSVGWFCEDNINYHPEFGSVGYKCVLNVPIVCPGIPPHHLQQITTPTGYNAYECVPNSTVAIPTCSSTETLTTIFTSPTNQYSCIQNWPWTRVTLPTSPPPPAPPVYACLANETVISNGALPPSELYGCVLNNNCPVGQSRQQTSPPNTFPITSACLPPPAISCSGTDIALPDPMVNPVTYHCCPIGNSLSINRATIPPTYTCTATSTPPTTCPPGQIPSTTTASSYYFCTPPDPIVCPPGQNYQTSACVTNSTHLPSCTASQTPEMTIPTSTTTCVPLPAATCPPGQVPNVTSYAPLTYTCITSTADPICTTGTHLVLAPVTAPYTPGTCVADAPGTVPTCAAGEMLNTISAGPPAVYSCVPLPVPPACPPGQTPRMVTMTPSVTYACFSEGN